MNISKIKEVLGQDFDSILNVKPKISKESLALPSSNWVDRFIDSNRSNQVLKSLQSIYGSGALKNTGYMSILPVDQGIEHSAGASFAPNPMYFDPENIVRLAIESNCSAVASTFGVLALHSRRYAHKIPFVVKINHNELLSYPNKPNQIPYGSVKEAWNLGASAIGATIYFGSEESSEQIMRVADAFEEAHEFGMATILWCYTRNPHFKQQVDYHVSADLTSQANHLGVTIQADIIKQKLPENNGGYLNVGGGFGKTHKKVYSDLTSDHPVDLCRYQVLNCYSGKISLINSGGASTDQDLKEALKTAMINKCAAGAGLILGRKAFQKPFAEGVSLLQAVQSVYLEREIPIL